MKTLSVVAMILLVASMIMAESKYICKVAHLGPNAVAITCTNGADPTGETRAGVLIISCGKE